MHAFHHTMEIQASVEAVFQAISNPTRLARWWGPDGFTNTFHEFNFIQGGQWNFTMHGPDGTNYPNEAVFTEITQNASVVIRHASQPHFTLSISLAASSAGTSVIWVQEFEDPSVAANVRHIVEPANEQNLARWANEVATFSRPSA